MATIPCLLNRVLLAFCAVAAPLSAADWLEWRGPSQNGVSAEKDLPETWEPGGNRTVRANQQLDATWRDAS